MFQIGKWFVILGVGSFILNLIGLEFRLLMWVDLWGPEVGTAIRAAFICTGVTLLYIGNRRAAPAAIESFDDVKARGEAEPA